VRNDTSARDRHPGEGRDPGRRPVRDL